MKWFYSEKLQLYISLEPLKINNQVFKIAKKQKGRTKVSVFFAFSDI